MMNSRQRHVFRHLSHAAKETHDVGWRLYRKVGYIERDLRLSSFLAKIEILEAKVGKLREAGIGEEKLFQIEEQIIELKKKSLEL